MGKSYNRSGTKYRGRTIANWAREEYINPKGIMVASFDGGIHKNPGGKAACACYVELDGNEVYRESRYLGEGSGMSNNVAEFEGLKLILEWIEDSKPAAVLIVGDSQVVINSMRKKRASMGFCEASSRDCLQIYMRLECKISFEWRRRHSNEECDAMCRLAIEEAA